MPYCSISLHMTFMYNACASSTCSTDCSIREYIYLATYCAFILILMQGPIGHVTPQLPTPRQQHLLWK